MTAIHKPPFSKPLPRNDIQWIRAIAVIIVVLYHIWPKIMPLGFLGVDMFFVVSGYLMTSIFAKTPFNCLSILQFYSRRIKRILPACMLVIFGSVYLAYLYFLPMYFDALKKEAIGAYTFSTNIQAVMTNRDYFFQLSELTFLLHTWSLGVEMQFYLLAPCIFAIISSVRYPLIPIIMLAIPSFFLQSFYLSTIAGFHLLFARIWQFMFGSIAFYSSHISETLENFNLKRKIDDILSQKRFLAGGVAALALIACLLFNHQPFAYYIRFIVTSAVCYVVAFNFQIPKSKYWTFSNSLMVYIGDASYSIYLIHWPIIQFARYFNYDEYFDSFVPLLIVICAASVLMYECFEKPLRNLSFVLNSIIIIFFYIFSVYLSIYANQPPQTLSNYPAIENAIQANTKLAIFQKHPCNSADETIAKFFSDKLSKALKCSFEYPNAASKPKKEVVIMANSFGEYQLPAISEALEKANFTKFYLFLQAGCLPYSRAENYEHAHFECGEWAKIEFDEFLDFVKPEFILLTARLTLFEAPVSALPSSNLLEADRVTQEFHERIANFASHTKHLILISPIPDIDVDNVYVKHLKDLVKVTYHSPMTIARALHQGFSLRKYVIPWKFVYETTHAPEVRLLAAISDCQNCAFFNTTQIYCNEKGCPLYDEKTKLGIYVDFSHVSNFGGTKLIEPLINFIKNITVL